MSKYKFKFGIIGDGRIAQRHKKAIVGIGSEVVRTFDLNALRPYALGAPFFCGLDYVTICSPPVAHYHHIKLARHHGVKVIVEKPMVLPWHPIVDDDDVNVVLQLRWAVLPKKAKVVRVVAVRGNNYQNSWKSSFAQTGGLFFEIFIHYIDLAIRLGATFDGTIISKGEQVRSVDGVPLFPELDCNDTMYLKMYESIVVGDGVKPYEIAKLHWLLTQCSEKFGCGMDDLMDKNVVITPDAWRTI